MSKPKENKKTTQKSKLNQRNKGTFPIVGMGASAGGLEALEIFLRNVPEGSGIAFVVIQHLDPTHDTILPQLLQRVTSMKVVSVTESIKIEPNCVYIISPNKSMSILKGKLHLFEPLETRGLRLPIDFFLRSLAEDQQTDSIGIILSGMGSDGTLGMRAIKEKGGVVLVQDPTTAKFDSMPRSVINDILVDIIAPPNQLPNKLITFLQHVPLFTSTTYAEIDEKSLIEKVIILLRTNTGHDFSMYKKNTLYRRIERRMGVHKIDKLSTYVEFMKENPKEVDILFKELLIGVTSFFRDSEMWELLKEKVIPSILINMNYGQVLRAWVPGCSTGEEAYSLAITFKEALQLVSPNNNISLQIFATDLDIESIERARKGIFPKNIIADVSQNRLDTYFEKEGDNYRINNEIREMVVFAQQNITMDPPFTKMDILSCRNLLIYLESELQKKLMSLFYYSLVPGGILILGSAETVGNSQDKFKPVQSKFRIYQRVYSITAAQNMDLPISFNRLKQRPAEKKDPVNAVTNIKTLADELLLQEFSPASVLVNNKGDIIYIHGSTGKYLEPPAGKVNWNIFAMVREGIQNEFPAAFRKALKQTEPVTIYNVKVGTNGGTQWINVTIKHIEKPKALEGMVMVVFKEVSAVVESKSSVKEVNNALDNGRYTQQEIELQKAQEELNCTLEEMQSTQEELLSANEELQSTNEELQSTNEELTTSKEEMQSLNEELQTVNMELQIKVDDYLLIDSDMKNLLNSTDIATLFLDKNLYIRRFTNQVMNIFKVKQSDIGRPYTDLATDLIYPQLLQDAREVLETLEFKEKSISTHDGRWFDIRIMPYYTSNGHIDGLVITLINITERKQAEEGYKNIQFLLESSIEGFKDMFVFSIDKYFQYLYFNKAYKDFMKLEYNKDILVGTSYFNYVDFEEEKERFKVDIERVMVGESFTITWEYGKEKPIYYQTLYKPILNEKGKVIGVTAFTMNTASHQNIEEILNETKAYIKAEMNSAKEDAAITKEKEE
jgi:two-component system, chemotaxis family, CheB/CheR fusion protein